MIYNSMVLYKTKIMETTLIESKKEFACSTIVKIANDYYLVSKKYYPETSNNKFGEEKYIAINLNDGKWFDWGGDIPCLNLEMEVFEKGTKFEITI